MGRKMHKALGGFWLKSPTFLSGEVIDESPFPLKARNKERTTRLAPFGRSRLSFPRPADFKDEPI